VLARAVVVLEQEARRLTEQGADAPSFLERVVFPDPVPAPEAAGIRRETSSR